MTEMLVLSLPAAEALSATGPWWRIVDGAVIANGTGDDWSTVMGESDRVIALVPAGSAPVRWIALPDLTPAQAQAAARLKAAETALGDPATIHVAAGQPMSDGRVPTAVVATSTMLTWLDQINALAVSVDALVPIAALPPPPDPGQAVRMELGQEAVLVTPDMAAVADPAIDALRVGAGAVTQSTGDAPLQWLAALADSVPLNLLQGQFAQQRTATFSPAQHRWLVRLASAAVLLAIALPLAQMWQWSRAAATADAGALAAARAAGVSAQEPAAAEAELDRRLSARGGGPLALSAPLGGLYRSLQSQPGVALRSLSHAANGTLNVTLAAPRIDDINALLKDLQARGFTITAQPMSGSDGMQMAIVTIRAVP